MGYDRASALIRLEFRSGGSHPLTRHNKQVPVELRIPKSPLTVEKLDEQDPVSIDELFLPPRNTSIIGPTNLIVSELT